MTGDTKQVKDSKARDKRIVVDLGMTKGTNYPKSITKAMKVEDHPFFGMNAKKGRLVAGQMQTLRRPRFGL